MKQEDKTKMVGHKQLMFLIHGSLLFFSVLMPILLTVSVQAATSTVTVIPSSLTAELENDFNIDISISDVLDLYGWEFTLTWNPYLLEAVSAIEGAFLKGDGLSTFFTYNISPSDGRIVVDCTLLGWISGVSGSGILATLTFSPKNYGECSIDLYKTLLIDSNEQPLFCQTSNGYARVISPHDVAISTVDVSPLLTSIGDPVNINVSIQNQGGYTEAFEVTAYVNSTIIDTQQTSLDAGSSTKVSFTWNTTAYAGGDYLVLATVGPVPEEVDLADNAKTADSLVTLLATVHDIAVTDVIPSKTVVGQGFCMFFNVTARNFGAYSETFNIITSANDTVIHTDSATLASGSNALLTFFWNVSGFPIGNYTIESYAEPVGEETITSDNAYVFGQVKVAKKGDINSKIPNTPDGRVDMWDIAAVARPFGTRSGDGLWNGNADITGVTLGLPDGIIDMRDISIVARSFGM